MSSLALALPPASVIFDAVNSLTLISCFLSSLFKYSRKSPNAWVCWSNVKAMSWSPARKHSWRAWLMPQLNLFSVAFVNSTPSFHTLALAMSNVPSWCVGSRGLYSANGDRDLLRPLSRRWIGGGDGDGGGGGPRRCEASDFTVVVLFGASTEGLGLSRGKVRRRSTRAGTAGVIGGVTRRFGGSGPLGLWKAARFCCAVLKISVADGNSQDSLEASLETSPSSSTGAHVSHAALCEPPLVTYPARLLFPRRSPVYCWVQRSIQAHGSERFGWFAERVSCVWQGGFSCD